VALYRSVTNNIALAAVLGGEDAAWSGVLLGAPGGLVNNNLSTQTSFRIIDHT